MSQTRFRGWHVRKYKEIEHSRGLAFSCEIWHGSRRAGDGRQDGTGGIDVIHIAREHQDAWAEINAYFRSVPDERSLDGSLDHSEEGFFHFLIDLFEADKALKSAKKRGAQSGITGYRYGEMYDSYAWLPEGLIWRTAEVPEHAIPEEIKRYVILGQDNQEIKRFVSPPETAAVR